MLQVPQARGIGEDSALRILFFDRVLWKPSLGIAFFSLSPSLSLFTFSPFAFFCLLPSSKKLSFLATMGVIFTEPKYPVVNKAPAFWETGEKKRKMIQHFFRFFVLRRSPINSLLTSLFSFSLLYSQSPTSTSGTWERSRVQPFSLRPWGT